MFAIQKDKLKMNLCDPFTHNVSLKDDNIGLCIGFKGLRCEMWQPSDLISISMSLFSHPSLQDLALRQLTLLRTHADNVNRL